MSKFNKRKTFWLKVGLAIWLVLSFVTYSLLSVEWSSQVERVLVSAIVPLGGAFCLIHVGGWVYLVVYLGWAIYEWFKE